MIKKNTDTRLTPQQLLQQNADELAEKHQQRLHQMTREAIYGSAVKRHLQNKNWQNKIGSFSGINRWAVVAPVFSLAALVLIWQVIQQPEYAATPSLVMKESIPGWVKDSDVPVAVIENVEFYQWLQQELKNEQEHEQKNNINT